MRWDDGIEGAHLSIAGSAHHRIGVIAGPGTGKTSYGLMRRVVRLLQEGVSGDRILLLSFTRVAAADLRDKIAELGVEGAENVRATTLHSYCFSVLKRESVLAITGRNPRILLKHEVDLMLRDIGGEYGDIHERRRTLAAMAAGWVRDISGDPGISKSPKDRDFEHDVIMWLRTHRAMLMEEVVSEAYRYLKANPAVPELRAFDQIIVDEYQDLNVLEQHLIDLLAESGSLCVAGDDDQSIYSVRYANPEGIISYVTRDEVEAHSIIVCGRCPANILDMANSLIGQAPGRHKDALRPRDSMPPGTVAIVQWDSVDAEVRGIVSAIAADVATRRHEPGKILVLTNWRKLGERIKHGLTDGGVDARTYFTEEELDSEAGKVAIALLRLVVDEHDAPALRVLIGVGDDTGRTKAYQQILKYCREHSERPATILGRIASGEALRLRTPALVNRFAELVPRLASLRGLELAELVNAILPDDQDDTLELREVALDALSQANSASDLLRILLESITQDSVPQNPSFIRIMSLHKSKGLTSEAVYIVGAVQGVLPTIRKSDPEAEDAAIAEGRRLFYVAVTRATRALTISHSLRMAIADANQRGVRFERKSIQRDRSGNTTVRTIACPYIRELGSAAPRSVRGMQWLRDR